MVVTIWTLESVPQELLELTSIENPVYFVLLPCNGEDNPDYANIPVMLAESFSSPKDDAFMEEIYLDNATEAQVSGEESYFGRKLSVVGRLFPNDPDLSQSDRYKRRFQLLKTFKKSFLP